MQLVKQGNQNDYNYKEFYLDTAEELSTTLATDTGRKYACPGSVAFIISTGDVYVLNSQKQWIKI